VYRVLRQGAAKGVMLDTSLLVAYFHPDDENHAAAREFFTGFREETIRARPLYTSEYVVGEIATTVLGRANHDRASEAVQFVDSSKHLCVQHVDPDTYSRAIEQFGTCSDQTASFTDHVIAFQAREHDVEYVVSFDGDFEVFDLVTLPVDG